jgi:predicted nucleic acid-binding protein
MNGNKLFVDTNILIYLLQGNHEIKEILEGKRITISFITEMELLSFPNLSSQEKGLIEELIEDCKVINVNTDIKLSAIEIRKRFKLKLPDAIIMASALYEDIPFLTADHQFEKVDDGEIILYQIG